jgi:2',3'-cyclic-nucleotide 2'-phosphodiesterase (5'-nucleotidase family)
MKSRKKYLHVLLLGFLFFSLLACFAKESQTVLQKPNNSVEIIVLNTGDIHEFPENLGKIKNYINDVRKKNKNKKEKIVILLDSGDLMDHNPNKHRKTGKWAKKDYSKSKGYKIYEWADKMGYDAMILGNHDLCAGIERTKELIEKFSLPFVDANVVIPGLTTPKNKPIIPPYRVLEREFTTKSGKKGKVFIGIIGFMDQYKKDYHGKDKSKLKVYRVNTDSCKKYVKDLSQQCDIIIFLSHNWDSFSNSRYHKVDNKYLAEMHGSMIIIGGHTHKKLKKTFSVKTSRNKRHLTKAGWKGEAVGKTVIKWDYNKPHKIISIKPSFKLMKDYL